MGSQSELHLGAASVRFMDGRRVDMAACSVRSRWDREDNDLRMVMLFQSML